MADNGGDRGFCHACGGVWLLDTGDMSRREDILKCPHCESDFTEIIEIPPETPPPPQETESQLPPVNPWADHNPWAHEETTPSRTSGWRESGSPGYFHRSYRSPDGRFTFSSTTIGSGYSSHEDTQPNPIFPLMMQSIDTIFQGLAGTHDNHQAQRDPGSDMPFQSHAAGMRGPDVMHEPTQAQDEPARRHERPFPRVAHDPQHPGTPMGNLVDFLRALQGDDPTQQSTARHGGAHATGLDPFAILSTLMNVHRNGDAVYSQEELDRVISELIEHTQLGTAAPPASENAIRALPKKQIDQQMMGSDGKAECSICMDSVELGTEVTVLPCTHWFHYDCIKSWLSQHNTCPHCRRSVDSASVTGPNRSEGTRENPVVIPDSPEHTSPERRRRRSSPFTLSIRSARSSVSRSSRNSPPPETGDSGSRRGSQGENSRGGITSWVWSRFGGGSG